MSFPPTHNSIFYFTALLMQWTLSDMLVLSSSVTCTFMGTFNMLLISFSTQQSTCFRAQVMLCGDAYSNCLTPPSGGSQQLVQNLKTCEVPMDTMDLFMIPGKHGQQSSVVGLGVPCSHCFSLKTPLA